MVALPKHLKLLQTIILIVKLLVHKFKLPIGAGPGATTRPCIMDDAVGRHRFDGLGRLQWGVRLVLYLFYCLYQRV
jgi:hypothetical protein